MTPRLSHEEVEAIRAQSIADAACDEREHSVNTYEYRRQIAALLADRDAGAWRPIEEFVPTDRAQAIIACPSMNKPGEWIVGEAIWLVGDMSSFDGWWWANMGPGDYYASPVAETNNAPTHFMPLPAPPSAEGTCTDAPAPEKAAG